MHVHVLVYILVDNVHVRRISNQVCVNTGSTHVVVISVNMLLLSKGVVIVLVRLRYCFIFLYRAQFCPC